jgi:nitrate/nitrite transporter NarK
MIRNIFAVLAGLAVGMVVNQALIFLNAFVLYPMPPGTSMEDPELFSAYITTLPTAAFLVVLAAHLGQSFVGGWVAARIGSSRPMLLAMIVGLFSLAGGVAMMTIVKGPDWMYIELPLYLVVAWQAGRMEVNRRAALGD